MKQIKVKDEYDEIAELDAQLAESTSLNAKKKRRKTRIEAIATAIRGIIGFSKLLAVCSIVYSTFVVLSFTGELITKILILPQVLLAAFFAIDAFITASNNKRSKK